MNHLLYENTAQNSYATLFFATYDDSSRRLCYVNCGHLPAPVLRAAKHSGYSDSSDYPPYGIERLESTSTVLGLFEEWPCAAAETHLAPGDILVLYTDGVTEATNAEGEEFSESRLLEVLKACRALPPKKLLEAIVAAVQKFASGEQSDDITLVVAQSG